MLFYLLLLLLLEPCICASFTSSRLHLSNRTWTSSRFVPSGSLLFATSDVFVSSSFLDMASALSNNPPPALPFSLFSNFPSRLSESSVSWQLRTSRRGSLDDVDGRLTWIQSRAFRTSSHMLVLPHSFNDSILLLNHASFDFNAVVSFEDGRLRVHSTRSISPNSEILINYVSDYDASYIPTWRLFMNYGFFPDDVNEDVVSVRFEWEEVRIRCVGLYESSSSSSSCSESSGLDVTTSGVMPNSMIELRLRTMIDANDSGKKRRVLDGLYADRESELRATKCLLNVLRGYVSYEEDEDEDDEKTNILYSAAVKLLRMESAVVVKYRNVLENVWKRVKEKGLL